MAAATILSVLALLLLAVNSQRVVMKISLERTSTNFVYVFFPNKTFEQFYKCLTQRNNQECHLKTVTRSPSQFYLNENEKLVVSVTNQSFLRGNIVNGTNFKCTYHQSNDTITCHRFYRCGNTFNQQFNLATKSCRAPCVYMCWTLTAETLIYRQGQNIYACDAPCTSEGKIPDASVNDNTSAQDNNNVPVIVGSICGACVIVIAVVIVILIWRRRRLGRSNCKGVPNRKLHSGNVNDSVVETLPETRATQISPDSSRERTAQISPDSSRERTAQISPDSSRERYVPSNFNDSRNGVKQDGELFDGYYTLDSDCTGNKHQVPPGQSHASGNDRLAVATVNQNYTNDYSYIDDSTAGNVTDNYATNVDVIRGNDGYSLVRSFNNGAENSENTEPQTVYSKLGENAAVMVNPYN